jgi:hypothetical protein
MSIRVPLAVLATVGLMLTTAATDCAEPTPPTPAPPPSLETVAKHPDRFLGKTVRVVGTLENEGRNYFTDLRLGLRDRDGNTIAVRPWLPLERPPGPAGKRPQPETQPETLAQHLGKTVTLTGVVKQGELGKRSDVYYLEVERVDH